MLAKLSNPESFNYLVPIRTGYILYPGAVLFMLRHRVDEYATEEIFLLEPLLQQIEQGEDALLDRAIQARQIEAKTRVAL